MQKFGLSSAEAEESLRRYGDNRLTQPPRETFLHKLLENFQDPIIKILLLALLVNVGFAAAGHGDWLETVGIFLAIILATFVSTYSEYGNENAFQKLQEEAGRIVCRVWRDGEPTEIGIDDIVKGDAIILQAGDRLPVDGKLLAGELKVDQAVLNGESDEARKLPASEEFAWPDKPDFFDKNRLYRGSVVTEGQGVMEAVQIGDSSVYGQLTQQLKSDDRDGPLKLKLKHLANQISYFGYVVGVLIALAVMAHKALLAGGVEAYFAGGTLTHDLVQAVILGVIIIVVAVPEGLPLMIAIVSSLNMGRMLRDNVLVRKLAGIETAGSLNILFTDKTGTITKGHLEVVRFLTGGSREFTKFNDLPEQVKEYTYENIALNTSAAVSEGKIVGGNMTEAALSRYIGSYRTRKLPERQKFLPFNSANKYSWAQVADRESAPYCLIKGAPERLVQKASWYWDYEGKRQTFTDEQKRTMDERMLEQATLAIRMLAVCTYDGTLSETEPLPDAGLTLVGIFCIRDDVRPEAVQAIREVQDAGVQVVMITGDRKETAVAIARDAGLLEDPKSLVWTSDELAEMSDEEIKLGMRHLRVVSRALPMDKSRLVRLAQEQNLVVGMTGDGVNDSPALKKADVGFAMGSGTEVAKEAGDIVILDDNFLSIKQAILYGRTIYNSICKFITFQLTINFSAVAINFMAPFIGIEKPLTIIQILWINLVMDTLAALAFGGEPPLEKYMKEAPKRRDERIVSKGMLASILLGGVYITAVAAAFFKLSFIDHLFRGAPDHIYTYTGFFCAYIFMAIANGFNVRVTGMNLLENLSANRGFLEVMALIAAVQVAMTYLGGRILRTAPLTAEEWTAVVLIGLSIIPVDLARKALRKLAGVSSDTNK